MSVCKRQEYIFFIINYPNIFYSLCLKYNNLNEYNSLALIISCREREREGVSEGEGRECEINKCTPIKVTRDLNKYIKMEIYYIDIFLSALYLNL